ncbi:MAG: RnfABCDGE type electron transport complex subunit D [Myxococcales bacterium]|nr:RnfABCDGE type electron transport complex subunit D [Myxococcales bacterium]
MSEGVHTLQISTSPFVHRGPTTRSVMLEVVAATVPVIAAATYYFGLTALLLVVSSVVGAVATEWLLSDRRGWSTLRDGSGLLTGILLALTLPPAIPLWMACLGGIVSMALGKMMWGGLGKNMFNPALVGRAFLQAAFPITLTTWVAPRQGMLHMNGSTFALPLMKAKVDIISSASPLGLSKFQHKGTELGHLLSGNTSGSLGETAAVLLIVIGLWLGLRRVFDWRLPVSTLLSVAVLSGLLHLWKPTAYPTPIFMLLSGGLLFGAVFMVTDPVTTPLTPRGAWIFGTGVGLLVVLIRIFGGLPEGVMYGILLMNALCPLIDKTTQPRRFGGKR